MIPRSLLALVAASSLAAACATQTPYGPADVQPGGYGYSDTQIESDRFRVAFAGNSLTDLDVVENNLLFRAAELTLERGYDWFEIVDRNTESESRLVGQTAHHSPFHYRYFHPVRGWNYYDPFYRGGFSSTTLREVTRYEAFAEIRLGKGETPDEPRAYNAREVDLNLRNDIVYPQT